MEIPLRLSDELRQAAEREGEKRNIKIYLRWQQPVEKAFASLHFGTTWDW
jgi:hypothetical protein